MNKIAIDITRAKTPPSLLGIDRRIAYANRKYHSGLMWTGVTRRIAGVNLSASFAMFGSFRVNNFSIMLVRVNSKMSFTLKYGWNGILSVFCLILWDYVTLFGEGIISGSILLLRIRIALECVRKNSCESGFIYCESSYSLDYFLAYVAVCCSKVRKYSCTSECYLSSW